MARYTYCPLCATSLQPFSDGERLRSRCPGCGWIHYKNPTVGVAVVLIEHGRLLLGRRRDGAWCIPCGYVEWDEHVEVAARREFREETGLEVGLDGLLAVHSNFHDPDRHTVGLWYRGQRLAGQLKAAADLEEVAFFELGHLPPLKFPTDRLVVEQLKSET